MTNLLLACWLLLAAAVTARVAAQSPADWSPDPTQPSSADDGPPLAEPRHIGFGMSPDEVVAAMRGEPDEKLSPDVWLYWNFRSPLGPALRKFDTLVVFFSSERVRKFHLVQRRMLTDLLADIRKTPQPNRPELICESALQRSIDDPAPSDAPRRIGCGMTTADTVRAMHGRPNEQLSPDIWVYWRFRISDDPAPKPADTLVVFFSQGRVRRFRLVDRATVLALLDEPRA